jgi:hypothetical protein
MIVKGSPYSAEVQLVEIATRVPPLVQDIALACITPKLCDSSWEMTRRVKASLL